MLETIGMSLIGTMISFLFDTQMLRTSTVDIQGAPYWYEQQNDKTKLYTSAYIDGGIDKLGNAKEKVVIVLKSRIEKAYDTTTTSEFMLGRDKKELDFIQAMKKDSGLKNFIQQKVVYQNIKYNEELNRIFIRGYVSIDALKKYQENRIIDIKKRLLDHQFDGMMEGIDKEAS